MNNVFVSGWLRQDVRRVPGPHVCARERDGAVARRNKMKITNEQATLLGALLFRMTSSISASLSPSLFPAVAHSLTTALIKYSIIMETCFCRVTARLQKSRIRHTTLLTLIETSWIFTLIRIIMLSMGRIGCRFFVAYFSSPRPRDGVSFRRSALLRSRFFGRVSLRRRSCPHARG